MGELTVDTFTGTEYRGVLDVRTADGTRRRVSIQVDPHKPHRIVGLLIAPTAEHVEVSSPVVLLNGTSSSGKTSLAKALQDALPGTWLHVSVDDFLHMASRFDSGLAPIVSGFHRSVGSLASAGNRLLVDHVIEERGWLEEMSESLSDTPVLVVGLRCPLGVLEQREHGRGDRATGLASIQFDMVHRHAHYDIEIDTSLSTVQDAAATVAERVVAGPSAVPLRAHLD